MRVVVLVSGRGSNLNAILRAIDDKRCGVTVAAVISDREAAPALALASERGIATAQVVPRDYPDRAAWDRALAARIASFAPEVVVLAGFMRIVGEATVRSFEGRMINVHPALLPAFPGMDGPAQAIKQRVSVSGCTVHVVDQGVDSGPILAQAVVPVLPSDDAAALHARIQQAEHLLLPAVLDAVADGRIVLGPEPRWVATPGALPEPLFWPPVVAP